MLYIACHDVEEANAQAARSLFASAKLSLPSNFVNAVASALCHRNGDVRSAAAAALSAGIQVWWSRSALFCLISSIFHSMVVLAFVMPPWTGAGSSRGSRRCSAEDHCKL